jgi:hypothetical protein
VVGTQFLNGILRVYILTPSFPPGPIKGVGFHIVPRLGLLLCKMIWRLLRDARDYDVVLVSGFNFMREPASEPWRPL